MGSTRNRDFTASLIRACRRSSGPAGAELGAWLLSGGSKGEASSSRLINPGNLENKPRFTSVRGTAKSWENSEGALGTNVAESPPRRIISEGAEASPLWSRAASTRKPPRPRPLATARPVCNTPPRRNPSAWPSSRFEAPRQYSPISTKVIPVAKDV